MRELAAELDVDVDGGGSAAVGDGDGLTIAFSMPSTVPKLAVRAARAAND